MTNFPLNLGDVLICLRAWIIPSASAVKMLELSQMRLEKTLKEILLPEPFWGLPIDQNSLNINKILSHTDWGAGKRVLLRLYRALVRSKLDYGCIIYRNASENIGRDSQSRY